MTNKIKEDIESQGAEMQSSKEGNLEGLLASKTAGMVEHELEAFQ